MSLEDQQRWDQRYAQGAYADRTHPSVFLQRRVAGLNLAAGSAALDIACGAGRNALYFAALGFSVTAIDGSSVAIERARVAAQRNALEVRWLVADLEQGLPAALNEQAFDLIVMIRYVNLPLLAQLAGAMKPGGYLLVEQHLRTEQTVGGPRTAAFRVARGALQSVAGSLECLSCEQGLFTDPDGTPMALSRLLARKAD